MNISSISGPITKKFYQKHHWDGGKTALGFGPDWIKTLVSMATVNDNIHERLDEFEIWSDPTTGSHGNR